MEHKPTFAAAVLKQALDDAFSTDTIDLAPPRNTCTRCGGSGLSDSLGVNLNGEPCHACSGTGELPRTTDAQVIELNEIRAITERETDPVRALRRRYLTHAIAGLTTHMLSVRTMLSEADVDDLPVLDSDSVTEPMAHLFYEASRTMETAARLATDREIYFPFLLSKLGQ